MSSASAANLAPPEATLAADRPIRDAVRAIGFSVRVGLHTGEIELHGDDIGGIAVHIAQRIQALAQPDEVLVSRTVADLAGGSGIPFADRGTHALKGVPNQMATLRRRRLPAGIRSSGRTRRLTHRYGASVSSRLVALVVRGPGLGRRNPSLPSELFDVLVRALVELGSDPWLRDRLGRDEG